MNDLTPRETGALDRRVGKALAVAGGTVVTLALGMVSVAYWGAGGGMGAIGGSGASGDVSFSYSAPNAPTLSRNVLSDSSVVLTTNAFAGSGDDTHLQTIYQVDTINGDWSTLNVADTLNGAGLTLDSLFSGMTKDGTFKARAIHEGTNGGESAWSDSVTILLISPSGFNVDYVCDHTYALGDSIPALKGGPNDDPSNCTNDFSGSNLTRLDIIDTLPGTTGWPFPRMVQVEWSGTYSSLMLQLDPGSWTGSGLDTLDVGEYQFWMMYDYVTQEVGELYDGHWFHQGSNVSPTEYPWVWRMNGSVQSDSTYSTRFGVALQCTGCGGRGRGYYTWPDSHTHVLYRREHRIFRSHLDSTQVDVRVYDAIADTLVASSVDFVCAVDCTGGDYLGEYKAAMTINPKVWRAYERGNNGPQFQPSSSQYSYLGPIAFKISSDSSAWIGQYVYPGGD